LGLLLLAACAAFLLAAAYVLRLVPQTPDIGDLLQVQKEQPSIVLAADGTELTVFRRMQREWVTLDQVAPSAIDALIATEDQRFYQHRGIDPWRIAAALLHTATGDMQGASTITQQLARNQFPEEIGRSRELSRKLKEMITAVRIEARYSKRQILETYLNTVPFLYNVFGIEMAARTYFGKAAAELGPLESATLIGMLKGTRYYNPVVNPERALARRNVVLGQMARQGLLSGLELESLREQPLRINFNRQTEPGPGDHFTEYVRRWVSEWADRTDHDLYTEGLVVHTTLDPALQKMAREAVASQARILQDVADVEWGRKSGQLLSANPAAYTRMRQRIDPFSYFWSSRPDLAEAFIRESPEYKKAVEGGESEAGALARLAQDHAFLARLHTAKTRLEAGFVAIDIASGEIKAWVGSRDFQVDQFDHVAQAARQPGSTFKPFVYGAALERGLNPFQPFYDQPVEIRLTDGDIWRPTDMGVPSGMPMAMREGLILSKNTITAQVMQYAGLPQVIDLAQAMGVNRSRLDPVPSLALGTSPVTLLEMVSAYSTIARVGEYLQPVAINSITDRHGKTVAHFGRTSSRALSERSALELLDMLRSAVSRGTGTGIKARFGITADLAGKTGTTQNNTDGWFIAMHPNLVAGAWIGFNDARVTMRSSHWGQGGHNALLVVGDFFKQALKERRIDAKARFPQPLRDPAQLAAPSLPVGAELASMGSGNPEAEKEILLGGGEAADPAAVARMAARRAVQLDDAPDEPRR
jgi:penicillin-binding protein 1A